jgi:hypothetical protein
LNTPLSATSLVKGANTIKGEVTVEAKREIKTERSKGTTGRK